MEYKDNIVNLFSLFTNESVALKFMMDNRLIYQEIFCNKCRLKMTLVIDNSKKMVINGAAINVIKPIAFFMGAYFMVQKFQCQKYYTYYIFG